MNIVIFSSESATYKKCECFLGHAFKTVAAWDNCALLARFERQLQHGFLQTRDNCVLFSKIYDCFECLSPHKIKA